MISVGIGLVQLWWAKYFFAWFCSAKKVWLFGCGLAILQQRAFSHLKISMRYLDCLVLVFVLNEYG